MSSGPTTNPALRIGLLLALGLLACRDGRITQRRVDFAVDGIDLSHHQAEVDWPRVARDGIDFAYLKATEGTDHVDSRFADNWPEARYAGLARGAYHFFRPDADAAAQARHFFATVDLHVGDLPPVLDVETTAGATRGRLVEGVREWLYQAEARYGVRPVIYTNLTFYYRHLAGHFDDYTFWVARYGDREPSIAPGARLALWQYGERGRVAGVEGPVDLNVFFGSRAAFDELLLDAPLVYTFGEADAGAPVAGH